jgi:aldehyde:ferredoxin oxidoreductase
MHGTYGRILTVDLTGSTFRIEPLPGEIERAFIGGKGIAAHLLLERNPAGTDPLGPDNLLIFNTGPFCQSPLWGPSRYGVYTRSPLTGYFSEAYSGGKVPEAVDATGFDAIVIVGRAARPTALTIHPAGVEFHDATDLWGMETFAAEDAARERFALDAAVHGKPGAVVIGPAGEKLLRFALIANDYWRCAGRTGVGAVMGSKMLKAVVFQGDRRRPLADPDGVAAYAREFLAKHRENAGVLKYKALGTTQMVAVMNKALAFPSRYWSMGTCDHWEKISGERFHQEHRIKPHACAKCFIACGRKATIASGRHQGLVIEGPEYETIYAFGGLCMVEEMAEIAWLNDLCDRLGMDTITAGNLAAFTIEAVRRGKVDYPVDYGDAEAIGGLIRLMAARTGIGDLLAEGIVAAAKGWGLEDLAVHVKGMEPAGYEPRVLKGMGLAYGTSDRGACHLRTTFYKPELAGMIAPDAIDGKAEMLIDFEDRLTIFDTLILCRFYRDLYPWEELERALALVTGERWDKAELRRVASRIADTTRRLNLREGLTPAADRLPKRLLTEALPTGHALGAAEYDRMLADYYRIRGWDEQGRPPE